MSASMVHDGRLRAVTRALVDDIEAALSEIGDLPAATALRHVCRRDAARARELLRNPRTRDRHSERKATSI